MISNGNTFKRFAPYPKSMHANHHVIYHPKIDALLQTPDGFGRCVEIYAYNGIDLQTPHPNFPKWWLIKWQRWMRGLWSTSPRACFQWCI
ncbi:hypothetical protein HBZS_121540 [Helicobacter bizzozeronii CCUG 35545]|nr:hypothetical protein HBZS_121540 [Helicobacter bizzozeronii CCUG 35545]